VAQTITVPLTADEQAVLEHLAAAWNTFLLLPSRHPDDVAEFRHELHALQNIVMARSVLALASGMRTEHSNVPVG